MFLGRTDEARVLYLAHRGEKLAPDESDLWEKAVLDDFAALRKAGLTDPLMNEIERLLKAVIPRVAVISRRWLFKSPIARHVQAERRARCRDINFDPERPAVRNADVRRRVSGGASGRSRDVEINTRFRLGHRCH